MTDTASTQNIAPQTKSRSLWETAFLRLRRNKAAMASAIVLVVYILAGMFGPSFAPHHYATVYSEYVKVPASLEPYPREESILPAAEEAVARARLDIASVELDGGVVRIAASSGREVDPRVTRYLDRSDLFTGMPASSRRPATGGASSWRPTCSACASSSAPTPTGATCSPAS
jgi:oligopeptide transport system permease protein